MGEQRTWWQAVSASVVERWTIASGPATALAEFERRAGDRRVVNRRFRVKRRGGSVRLSNGAVTADVSARATGPMTEITVWIDSLGWSFLGNGIARLVVGLVLLAAVGSSGSTGGGWVGSITSRLPGIFTMGGPSVFLFAVPGLFMMLSGFQMLVALPAFPSQRKRMLQRVAETLVGMGATFHAEPGWHPAPDGRPVERWWDGTAWTDRERPRSDDGTLDRKILLMQVVAVPVFFAGMFGLFVLPSLLHGSGSSSGRTFELPYSAPRVPTVPPTAVPDAATAAGIERVAEVRLRRVLSLGPDAPLRVRVRPDPCAGCVLLWVETDGVIDPDAAKVALGAGELTARPVAVTNAVCGAVSDGTWTTVPWIVKSPSAYQCASVDPAVATLAAAEVGTAPAAVPEPGRTPGTGVVTLRLRPSPELATWVTGHPGQMVTLALDGAVVAELDSATAGAAALGFPVSTPPLEHPVDRAVVAALSPPAMPR